MRLTMQEVIEHCERTAKRIEDDVKYCREWLKAEQKPLKSKRYLEHKQTAEWLKELQRYKDLEEQGSLIERKYGVWISVDFNKIACSECKHTWNIMRNDVETFECCPKCGATMITKAEAEAKLAEMRKEK